MNTFLESIKQDCICLPVATWTTLVTVKSGLRRGFDPSLSRHNDQNVDLIVRDNWMQSFWRRVKGTLRLWLQTPWFCQNSVVGRTWMRNIIGQAFKISHQCWFKIGAFSHTKVVRLNISNQCSNQGGREEWLMVTWWLATSCAVFKLNDLGFGEV